MANSVDPDQTPRSAASDLGLHCLQSPILRAITVYRNCLNCQLVLINSVMVTIADPDQSPSFAL